MRIQEMKSGILHLKKKMGNERREKIYEMQPTDEAIREAGLPLAADSELDEPRWSVVSFDQCEAGGLTYPQAATLMSELDAHGVVGLCIITDSAASRLRS